MNFTGKVIIVTGASSGIGADAAKHLSKLGGKLCLVGRNEKRLNGVADEIGKSGAIEQPLVILADVTTDAERIINESVNHFGKLDILINNAGVFESDNIFNFKATLLDELFNINLRAVAILTSLAVPHLEKTKGNIVNISSVAGMKAMNDNLSYSISKAALDQFTKCVALKLAPKGIRVNSINPGMIKTPTFEKDVRSSDELPEFFENAKKIYPMGRIGEQSDTSAAIAFVASDSASFITGVLLPCDGGFLIKL